MKSEIIQRLNLQPTEIHFGAMIYYKLVMWHYKDNIYFCECDAMGVKLNNDTCSCFVYINGTPSVIACSNMFLLNEEINKIDELIQCFIDKVKHQ